jgi:uncharacterized protein (TIGR03437 family)
MRLNCAPLLCFGIVSLLIPQASSGQTALPGATVSIRKLATEAPVATMATDRAGRFRLSMTEPGDYILEVYSARVSTPRERPVQVSGQFLRIGPRDVSSGQATGKRIGGNTLFDAGVDRGDGTLILSTPIRIPVPMSVTGRVDLDEDVGLSHQSLTFEATNGGPRAPSQSLKLTNAGVSVASWSATFEPLTSRWSATLSKGSGVIAAGATDTLLFQPAAGLAPGAHQGLLKLRIEDDGRVRNLAVDVTVNVAPAEASIGNTFVEGISQALLPAADGTYESVPLRIVNNTSTAQVYAPRAEAGLSVSPASLSVPAGGAAEFSVQPLASPAVSAPRWQYICVVVATPTGPRRRCYWKWNLPPNALSACTPTALRPVLLSTSQPVPRRGHAIDVTYQVFDDCGRVASDYTAVLRLKSGAERTLLAARHVPVSPLRFDAGSNDRAALAGAAPEQSISGLFYPYFREPSTILELEVESRAGLAGIVETELLETGDATAPHAAAGAFVPNSTYEQPSPMAPLGIFSFFALVPGLDTAEANSLPFPPSLGGVRLYVDGEDNVPLIRAANGQINGIVPQLAPGRHVAHIYFNAKLSGGVSFHTADANPAPLFADIASGTPHLYDSAGRLVSESNPLRAEQIYAFYADSLGAVNEFNAVPGAATPPVASSPRLRCSVSIAGATVVPEYCGYSPGSPALWQVNFKMPPVLLVGARPGDLRQVALRLNQDGHEGTHQALAWVSMSNIPFPTPSITFTTDPPNRGLQYTLAGTNGMPVTRADSFGPNTYQLLSNLTVNVPNTLQQSTQPTRYQFQTWTSPITPNSPIGTIFITNSTPSVITAKFQTQHRLTILGSGVATGGGPLAGGYYVHGSQVTLTSNCSGQTAGLLIQKGSLPAQLVQSPATVVMDAPVVVTVVCAPGAALNACLPPPGGLIGWWPLDENSGTVAANLAATNANGTYNGGNPVAGYVAGARNFAAGGHVTVANSSGYNFPASPTRAFTFDAWVRGGSGLLKGTHRILNKRATSGTPPQLQGYIFSISDGNLTLLLQDLSGTLRVFGAPIPLVANNAWHLVAATVDFAANQGYLFFDGIPVLAFQPGALAGIAPTAPLEFARFDFLGQLDEIEIFNRALNIAEVQNLFRAREFGKCKSIAPTTFNVSAMRPVDCAQLTVNGSSQLPITVPANSTVTLNVTPNMGGLAAANVTINGLTSVYTSFPATFTATGNATITATCVNAQTTCVTPPSNMVGWYKLEETAAPLLDSTASPSHIASATFSNPVAAGKVGRAWRAATLNAAWNAGSPAKYNFGLDSFAVDLWLKFDGSQAAPFSIVRKASSTAGFNILIDNGALRLDINNSLVWKGTRNIMADKLWHHVTVNVARPGGPLFIVDGQIDPFTQSASLPSSLNVNNAEPLLFGGVEVNLDEIELFNRALTVAEAQALYLADSRGKCPPNSCPAGSIAPPPGLKGWWGFSPATATSIPDLSGNGNTGAINVRLAGQATRVGPAFSMDTSSFMEVPHATSLNFGAGAMSIDMWVRWPAGQVFTSNPVLVAKLFQTDDNTQSKGWSFALGPDVSVPGAAGLTFVTIQPADLVLEPNKKTATNWVAATPTNVIPGDGNWHLVGMVFDGSLTQFYVDGVAVSSTTNKSGANIVYSSIDTDTTRPLRLGVHWNNDTALKFSGDMDEVEIFNRVLTAAEMLALYQAGPAGKCDGANSSITHTVATSPTGLRAQDGAGPLQVAPFSVSWITGATSQLTAPQTQLDAAQSTLYALHPITPWTASTGASITNTGLVASSPAVPSQFTANYVVAGYKVTVENTPACSVNVGSGGAVSTNPLFVAPNSLVNVIAGAGNPVGYTRSPLTTQFPVPSGFLIGAPTTITPICSSGVAHTVATIPANLQIKVDSLPQQAAPQAVQWTPGTAHQLSAPSPQFNTAQDIRYTLRSSNAWTATGGAVVTNAGAVASAPTTATTYTAHFDLAYKVTVVSTGCGFSASLRSLNPGVPSSVTNTVSDFVPAGTVVTGAISPAGAIVAATVNGIPLPIGASAVNTTINAPTTIEMRCAEPRLSAAFVSRTALTGSSGIVNIVIRITNSGIAAANNAQASTAASAGTVTFGNPTNLGTIAPGQSVTYNIHVTGAPQGSFIATPNIMYVNAANNIAGVYNASFNVP